MITDPGSGFTHLASNSDCATSLLWMKFLPHRIIVKIKQVNKQSQAQSLAGSSKVRCCLQNWLVRLSGLQDLHMAPAKISSLICCSLTPSIPNILISNTAYPLNLVLFPAVLSFLEISLPPTYLLILLQLSPDVTSSEETIPDHWGWRRYLLCVPNTAFWSSPLADPTPCSYTNGPTPSTPPSLTLRVGEP